MDHMRLYFTDLPNTFAMDCVMTVECADENKPKQIKVRITPSNERQQNNLAKMCRSGVTPERIMDFLETFFSQKKYYVFDEMEILRYIDFRAEIVPNTGPPERNNDRVDNGHGVFVRKLKQDQTSPIEQTNK